ncbi:MAG: SAM-dependent chlorinase/fluorinase [Acidobacteria bacterium]|nr:SAM-dependent chlorinase/fluorinase [Acidobacteriota bacterium]
MKSVVTLLTDFGTADYFVGAVKGVILTINPHVSIVDITHEIPPQDIEAGAFTLLTCYRDFPAGTIHMTIVDPGVGSTRRPIVVSAGSHYFVGPDNGLFSYVLDREPSPQTFHVTAREYFREEPSSTFHGRDIFAPVAAALSKGVKPDQLGPQIENEVRLPLLLPAKRPEGKVEGRIIHIDRFGNCITNLTRADLPETEGKTLLINGTVIKAFRQFYADEDGSENQIFAIWGSAGFLELSVSGASAAKLLHAKRGDSVIASA